MQETWSINEQCSNPYWLMISSEINYAVLINTYWVLSQPIRGIPFPTNQYKGTTFRVLNAGSHSHVWITRGYQPIFHGYPIRIPVIYCWFISNECGAFFFVVSIRRRTGRLLVSHHGRQPFPPELLPEVERLRPQLATFFLFRCDVWSVTSLCIF